jgi:hypothetical protein
MNERDELAAVVEQAMLAATPLSHEQIQAKIERGFLQSEHCEIAGGETFAGALLAELDDLERKHRAG